MFGSTWWVMDASSKPLKGESGAEVFGSSSKHSGPFIIETVVWGYGKSRSEYVQESCMFHWK